MFKKKLIKGKAINTEQIQLQKPENQEKEQLDEEPKKKIKRELPRLLGSSTVDHKQKLQKETNQKFDSLNYKAKERIESDKIVAGQEAIQQTQTQLARRKYLQNIQMTKDIKEGKISKNIYRGQNNYANYKISEEQLQNPLQHYKKKHGPTRDSKTSLKNTCRFDYDKSLCKDYHDTGYCVFGNSCIYIHDRSNYKTGWEQEKDFERSERERWKRINNPTIEEDELIKDLQQFKVNQNCQYCGQQFKTPVQVECKHIFCMKCAVKMNNSEKKCISCQKKLGGIMNNAQKLLKQKKIKYEELLKMTRQGNELMQSKKVDYKNVDSIDVFND